MSKRVVQVRSVRDYVNAALLSLDKAASAAMRCDDVPPPVQQQIVREYRALSRVSQQLDTITRTRSRKR